MNILQSVSYQFFNFYVNQFNIFNMLPKWKLAHLISVKINYLNIPAILRYM